MERIIFDSPSVTFGSNCWTQHFSLHHDSKRDIATWYTHWSDWVPTSPTFTRVVPDPGAWQISEIIAIPICIVFNSSCGIVDHTELFYPSYGHTDDDSLVYPTTKRYSVPLEYPSIPNKIRCITCYNRQFIDLRLAISRFHIRLRSPSRTFKPRFVWWEIYAFSSVIGPVWKAYFYLHPH